MNYIKENKKILPKKEIIKLPNEELQIDLYYNNLSSQQLAAAKQEIESTFYDFKDQYGIKQHSTGKILSIFIHDNKSDYDKYAHTKDEGMDQYSHGRTNFAYMYYYIHDDPQGSLRNQVSYALTYYNGKWDKEKILPDIEPQLGKEKTVELDEYNFIVRIYYNNLNDNQLKAAQQEIKKTFSDFDKLYGLKKSNSLYELQLYIYDNKNDYRRHAETSAYGVEHPYWNGNNVAKTSIYKFDDEGVGFIGILEHELTYNLILYSSGSSERNSETSYKMVNDSLHITDNKTGDTIKMPKSFKYLKLEDSEDEKSISYDEKKVSFGDYDEGEIFSIQPDKVDPQVARIFDTDENEIGVLFNNYLSQSSDPLI